MLNLFFKLGISKFKYRSRGLECCNRGCISSLFLPIKANHVKTYHFYSCKAFLNLAMAKKYIIHRLSPCVITFFPTFSSTFLLVVESWNGQHHGQTIHPTEKFNSINCHCSFKVHLPPTFDCSASSQM